MKQLQKAKLTVKVKWCVCQSFFHSLENLHFFYICTLSPLENRPLLLHSTLPWKSSLLKYTLPLEKFTSLKYDLLPPGKNLTLPRSIITHSPQENLLLNIHTPPGRLSLLLNMYTPPRNSSLLWDDCTYLENLLRLRNE